MIKEIILKNRSRVLSSRVFPNLYIKLAKKELKEIYLQKKHYSQMLADMRAIAISIFREKLRHALKYKEEVKK